MVVLQTHTILSGSETIDFTKIKEFLHNGSVYSTLSTTNLHLLSAWSHSTLLGHNCAVKKYLNFLAERHTGKLKLPISSSDVEAFCVWAGRNNAKADKLKVIVQKKPAVMLWHLVFLFNTLSKGTNFDRALADLVLVAFWGMARLSKLTYHKGAGNIYYGRSILTSDVTFSARGQLTRTVLLTIRGAKTANPGIAQTIALGSQPNMLCPLHLRAVERRLAEAGSGPTSLFGYNTAGLRVHLMRRRVVDWLQQVLFEGGHEQLLGHSFRVGGASFRNVYGMTLEDICRIGSWISSCNKLYIRDYSEEAKDRTTKLSSTLNSTWRRITI
ncbi:hypothetical protein MJO28_000375 [Puccinia striiformis f. sp. tritici]|uniref:Uncharacterized protein n=1 Tax=Puccinia striiformis f. sp. tritici TaxID=168172 RepID=A0ACC0EYB9_9BASI|nr:hypothetical protein MJO28_000375 [Puccinia striiformis f. sp. tritici]